MALTKREVIDRNLDLLVQGMADWVKKELVRHGVTTRVNKDPQLLLKTLIDNWQGVFSNTLGDRERNYVHELRTMRNYGTHREDLTFEDVERTLMSIAGLLTAIGSATEAQIISDYRLKLVQTRIDDSARKKARTAAETAIRTENVSGNLKPWREVAKPHNDVQTGRWQEADYAANLWEVFQGRAGFEYGNPEDFFRRTYLTEGLKRLLTDAVARLTDKGGTPVYELMTNFGGGKTHSLLALYHLFGGTPAGKLKDVPELLSAIEVQDLPTVRCAVIVGTLGIAPGQPSKKTGARTIWGEIAHQIGGAEGYELVRLADESGTNPGDAMRELFTKFGPCLVLLDEWIAYARQLGDEPGSVGGTFETQLTFAQTLCEAALASPRTLVVISLPESKTEIGGARGEQAHEFLKSHLKKFVQHWRPAEREESYEIVRRRMFSEIDMKEAHAVVRAFRDMYSKAGAEFPLHAADPAYQEKMLRCYPIHPEFFDRLYEDWAPLENFQHTRGVLKLTAGVISGLWTSDDTSRLIMPGALPLANERVRSQITSFLSNAWNSVIDTDVDGVGALPMLLDEQFNNLGRYSATRRVARAVFLGSAPSTKSSAQGISDKHVLLGCVQPGEQASSFDNALHRLADQASHLYSEGQRYWFDTKVTHNRIAQQYADGYDKSVVIDALVKELGRWKNNREPFRGLHPAPASSADVTDSKDVRLVVLRPDQPYGSKLETSPAVTAALDIVRNAGERERSYRNCLVFAAADAGKVEGLELSARKAMAWDHIINAKESLNLDVAQLKDAQEKSRKAHEELTSKLAQAYEWVLCPVTHGANQLDVEFESWRVTGSDTIAQRASTKLQSVDLWLAKMAPRTMRKCIDRPIESQADITLWRGNHLKVAELEENFARYLYLPKLRDAVVLYNAIEEALKEPNWQEDGVAIADDFDAATGLYSALVTTAKPMIRLNERLLVKPDVARAQVEPEQPAVAAAATSPAAKTSSNGAAKPEVRRFYGRLRVDLKKMDETMRKLRDEVLLRLAEAPGADVQLSLEIAVKLPNGIDEHTRMVVNENCNQMQLDQHGFESQ